MAKFNPETESGVEVRTLLGLATLLSDCEAFAEISETTVGAEARAKITTGPMPVSWEGGGFTKDELANLFCQAQIFPAPTAPKLAAVDGGTFLAPRESGVFAMSLRRYAREQEMGVDFGNDLYMWFLGRLAAMETELMKKMEFRECPRLQFVRRDAGPMFGQLAEKPAQGEYLWANYSIGWGDPEE